METVHILSAISRPDNLPQICESVVEASKRCKKTKIVWRWLFDIERSGMAFANQMKNQMIEDVTDGWIWILDDDTSVHPDLFLEFENVASESVDAVVVCQQRADGIVLIASPENSRVNCIDANQVIFRKRVVGENRMNDAYNADGIFLEAILHECNAVYLQKVLCYHNLLT